MLDGEPSVLRGGMSGHRPTGKSGYRSRIRRRSLYPNISRYGLAVRPTLKRLD